MHCQQIHPNALSNEVGQGDGIELYIPWTMDGKFL